MTDAIAGLTTRLHSVLSTRYRVERLLGQGGMAVVYLARDLRHDRLVALKLLRPELTAIIGAERFLQEIRVVAQLQHPHILPLFDSGETDSLLFYVMPYVEGESLRARLVRERQLPIDDAVRIADQVASALDYAHRHGVIHRDIKPENILLRDGQAVLADFGIALAVSNAGGARLTETGLSLGTPHYMSPEQATGERELDRRTDIYALGAVSYEMLVGEPPHTGPTAQAVIAKLLTEEPHSVTAQRHTVPAHIDRTITRALAKLAADRWATAGEFAAALGNPQVTSTMAAATPAAGSAGSRARILVPWAVAAASLALAVVFGGRAFRAPAAVGAGIAAALLPPPGEEFAEQESFGQLSPDGRQFVFATQTDHGTTRLWVRPMDSPKAYPLDYTVGAEAPFWSPDGRSIAFFLSNRLMRMDLPRGAPRALCVVRGATSGVWSARNEIIFGAANGLYRGSAENGNCKLVVRGDPKIGEEYRHPTILSDGRHVLATVHTPDFATVAVDLETGDRRRIAEAITEPTFIAPDLLLYADVQRQRIFAARFDQKRLAILGEPVPVSDSVRATWAVASYTVSANGLLLILPYRGTASVEPTLLTTGSGELLDTVRYEYAWTSRLAHTKPVLALGSEIGLSAYDLTRGTETPILGTTPKVDGPGSYPQWSPNDTSIAVQSIPACGVYVTNLRTGQTRQLLAFPSRCPTPSDWSTDGRYLLMTRAANDSVGTEIWLHDFTGGADRPVVTGVADYSEGVLSPDRKWLAYVSNETGWPEVFIRPFNAVAPAERVSTTSGRTPRWRGGSRSLDFITADGRLVETRVVTGDRIDVGPPHVRFRVANWSRSLFTDVSIPYDMTADGTRFVVVGGSPRVATLDQNVFLALGFAGGRK